MTRRWLYQRWFLLLAATLLMTTQIAQAQRRGQGRDSWQQPARVVKDLNLDLGDVVADIGAGRGYFTFRLSEAVGENGTVFATEINADALESIKKRAEERNVTNIETVVSEPTDTKLETGSLNAAFICDVLHHVPQDQRQALVTDIARALKAGGFFFIVDWRVDAQTNADRDRRIPKEDLIELGEKAGLDHDAEFFYLRDQVFLRLRKPEEAERSTEN
jgi:ubiquinone/menaquinone biosynthesis C-methylase UbiE